MVWESDADSQADFFYFGKNDTEQNQDGKIEVDFSFGPISKPWFSSKIPYYSLTYSLRTAYTPFQVLEAKYLSRRKQPTDSNFERQVLLLRANNYEISVGVTLSHFKNC